MSHKVFSARVRRKTANEYLSQRLVLDILGHFAVFLDGLVDLDHPVPYQVRLDSEDSIVGLLVLTVDETVTL